MNIPENIRYTKDHEWVKTDNNIAIIGITDYAQRELGDIIYVDITATGNSVKAGESLGSIEAVKTVSDIFAPVSGNVIEFNSSVNDNPAVVNEDPYGGGWIVKIQMSEMDEINNLMSAEEYRKLVGS